MNFRENVSLLNALLGLNLSNPASERNVSTLSQHVYTFYENPVVESVPIHACFYASFDGKGVPKIKLG